MIIRFKKLHPNAVTPAYSRDGDAAVDLTAVSTYIDDNMNLICETGIAIEIPKGYVGLIYPRSSLINYNLTLSNHVGVIDSNYRGEIIFKFKFTPKVDLSKDQIAFEKELLSYRPGNRIGQLIIQPIPEMSFVEVNELTPSNRGAAGFGSSGV